MGPAILSFTLLYIKNQLLFIDLQKIVYVERWSATSELEDDAQKLTVRFIAVRADLISVVRRGFCCSLYRVLVILIYMTNVVILGKKQAYNKTTELSISMVLNHIKCGKIVYLSLTMASALWI